LANDVANEVRAAAFARIARLRDTYGGRIPRAALSIQTSVDSPYADVQDAETGEIAYKYRTA
jgi:hypothetical protein